MLIKCHVGFLLCIISTKLHPHSIQTWFKTGINKVTLTFCICSLSPCVLLSEQLNTAEMLNVCGQGEA